MPSYEDLKDSDEKHQMHGFGHPLLQKAPKALVVFESGKGAMLYDIQGNEYIDGLGGITVGHSGYGREDIARVAYEQVTSRPLQLGRRGRASDGHRTTDTKTRSHFESKELDQCQCYQGL